MLYQVRSIWFDIDDGRGQLELSLDEVAKKLCQMQVLPDKSTAEKYICLCKQNQDKLIDYDDFNSIFCKGIFKYSIINKAQSIEQATAEDPNSNPEETLKDKLRKTKNINLMDQLNMGRLKDARMPAKVVNRPILSTLWQIYNKSVDQKDVETYEQYFNRMQGLIQQVVEDPSAVELDPFSNQKL